MDVSLATFNLENLGLRPGEGSPEAVAWLSQHVQALRAVLRRLDADALAFQEVVDPTLLDELLAGFDYPYRVVSSRASSPLRCGVASRYPLGPEEAVAGGVEFRSVDRKTGMRMEVAGPFSRAVLRVEWRVPGLPITLYVVHWKSKLPSYVHGCSPPRGGQWPTLGDVGVGRLVTETKRLAQAVELRRAVDRQLALDPAARLVVLGDFNDTLGSEGLRILRGDARACESPALLAAELFPAELSIPEPARYSQVYRGRGEMIDHALLSRALVPHLAGVQILNEGLRESDVPPYGPYAVGSDHAPLKLLLRV